jgi:hypothetical protein
VLAGGVQHTAKVGNAEAVEAQLLQRGAADGCEGDDEGGIFVPSEVVVPNGPAVG